MFLFHNPSSPVVRHGMTFFVLTDIFSGKKAQNKLKVTGKMTPAIAKVAGKTYLCIRNRHITL